MDRNVTVTSAGTVTIEDCLTCYLCGEIYRRPRVLPCGHTFCSECLARLKDEILHEGQYQRSEPTSEISDFVGSNYRDWLRPSDYSPVPRRSHSSPGGSSKNSDDSVNTDSHDADPNCYRPRSSNKSQFRRSDPGSVYQSTSNGFAKSGTSTRESLRSSSEHISSSYSSSLENINTSKSCSHCGHVIPMTPPQKIKMSQRITSARDKSPKGGNKTVSGPRWDNSPQKHSVSAPPGSFEQKHGKEMEPFVCPLPECSYSMRVMNLARWSPRNKTVADVVGVWRRMMENKQDSCTQTDISTHQSVLVTIPRSLMESQSLQPLGHRRRHSSMVDMAIDSAVSMDSMERGYIPREHLTWRSYAAMIGMNILHQIVNL